MARSSHRGRSDPTYRMEAIGASVQEPCCEWAGVVLAAVGFESLVSAGIMSS